MFIKKFSKENTKKTIVMNIAIQDFDFFNQEGNSIVFGVNEIFNEKKGIETVTHRTYLDFASDKEAEEAIERIFERLSMKMPIANTLDLTISPEEQEVIDEEAEPKNKDETKSEDNDGDEEESKKDKEETKEKE